MRDIDRTFPSDEMFRDAVGKECLMNVLKAYALFDPEVGYCQGMAFLVGVLLMF